MTPTDVTATGTETAPTDEVVVGVGEEEREGLEEEEEEMEGVEEEGGKRSRGTQVETGAEGTIRAAERAGGRAMWWRGVPLGKGEGEGGWEGKGVAWRKARSMRKRKAAEGANARRAKQRKLAREAKAAETRTDDGDDAGVTTTSTGREGTANDEQSLPSSNVGASPGTPAFQSSPIPTTSNVRPRKYWLKTSSNKTFVLRRDEGIDLTFIHRPNDPNQVATRMMEVAPNPSKSKNERKKKEADRGRGGIRRVDFYQDPVTPALQDEQNKKAAESRAAIARQRQQQELDALCPPRALPPQVKDVRVTDAGGVGPWETRDVEKKKRDKELWRRHAYETPQQYRGPRVHERRRRDRKEEEDFEEKAKKEEWDRLRKKFDEEREERKKKEEYEERKERKRKYWKEEDEMMEKMEGDPKERRAAANMRRVFDEHYDQRRVEDLRERIPKARHAAPIHPPSHDDDRREAAEKLARLEKLDREMEEEAKKVEEEKKKEKKRIQKEIERQRDILVRVDDDESRDNSAHSRRDSSKKESRGERRPPGYSPGTTLTPTPAPLPSTRPSRQETLKRQEVRPKERKGEPTRRRDSSNDRRRRR